MKTDTKTIGGFKYRMEQVGAETGEQIVLRLSRPLTALFAKVADAAAKGGPTEVSLERLVMTGLGPAVAQLSGKDLRYVRKKLAEKTVVFLPDGKNVREWPLAEHYDEHFAGRYVDAALWLKWGLGMNRFFGDALERADAMWAAHQAAKKARAEAEASRSSSPPDAVGGPGASSSPSTAPHA